VMGGEWRVGSFAVQLAKAFGAARKHGLLSFSGVDDIVVEGGGEVELVVGFDTVIKDGLTGDAAYDQQEGSPGRC
jgi:NADPH:quinone reductase-like Zn-dependent oxidoreductase